MSASFTWKVEINFGAGFIEVTDDIFQDDGITLQRSIGGNDVTDRVQSPGSLSFSLDNSQTNSGAKLGYYSPGHADCRSGFTLGAKVRFSITYSGTTYYKFYGLIVEIEPGAGTFRERRTKVQAVDYMNQFLIHNMSLVAVQSAKTSADLMATVVGNMPIAPLNTSYATGTDTFTYALHDIKDESTPAINVLQRICQSDMSYCFINGNTTDGELLKWANRYTIMLAASDATFSNTMEGLQVKTSEAVIWNTVKGTGYPAQVGTSNEVLWTQRNELTLVAGETRTITAAYTDPSGAGTRVGLSPTTGVTPVADTDYKFSSVSRNGGNDLNASLGITVTFGGNSATVALTNNHPTLTGYIGGEEILQIRGKIIRLYDPSVIALTDTTSKNKHGDKTLTFDMPYQDNVNTVYDITSAILGKTKSERALPDEMSFGANNDSTLMAAAMALDIGKKVTLTEAAVGYSAKIFAVMGYGLELRQGQLKCTLAPLISADTESMWVLGDATLGVLDSTTILGY